MFQFETDSYIFHNRQSVDENAAGSIEVCRLEICAYRPFDFRSYYNLFVKKSSLTLRISVVFVTKKVTTKIVFKMALILHTMYIY
jgi:hypothetical protein